MQCGTSAPTARMAPQMHLFFSEVSYCLRASTLYLEPSPMTHVSPFVIGEQCGDEGILFEVMPESHFARSLRAH